MHIKLKNVIKSINIHPKFPFFSDFEISKFNQESAYWYKSSELKKLEILELLPCALCAVIPYPGMSGNCVGVIESLFIVDFASMLL